MHTTLLSPDAPDGDDDRNEDESIQSKGGKARSERLTDEEKSDIARRAANARWSKTEDRTVIPEATHDGFLQIGDVQIECYNLKNGKRLIHKRGMAKALGMKSEGGNAFMKTIGRKGLGSQITTEILDQIDNPLVFKPLIGDPAHGYEATFLIDICTAIMDAGKAGKLRPNQAHLAIQSEIIVRAAAKVGITALVDEATGYIADKRKEEYRELFQQFIRDEFSKYEKEFPQKLFDMIYKIYGLKRSKLKPHQHPQFFGKFIRKYIYEPLASSEGAILQLLDEKNPVVYVNGGRRYKMFQFLTDVVGMPALRAHLWQIVGIGSTCSTKEQFERRFRDAFPVPGDQVEFDLGI
jgi:hypothetical protein